MGCDNCCWCIITASVLSSLRSSLFLSSSLSLWKNMMQVLAAFVVVITLALVPVREREQVVYSYSTTSSTIHQKPTTIPTSFYFGANHLSKGLTTKCSVSSSLSLSTTILFGSKGFGVSSASSGKNNKKSKPSKLIDTLQEDENGSDNKNKKKKNTKAESVSAARPFVKSEQEEMIASLALRSSKTCIGQVIVDAQQKDGIEIDPFWELIPSLITSRFPTVPDNEMHRIAGFIRHAINPNSKIVFDDNEQSQFNDEYRPQSELHAYMPQLGPTQQFYNPQLLPICQLLTSNYDIILKEYETLVQYFNSNPIANKRYGFQSVTALNYDSGWTTLVLFYNGHRIHGFPYNLCPITTKVLETVPIAGRIAGFNCQLPLTGIPEHTDGNNMWLTCQMGLVIPDGNKSAYIKVGTEQQYWEPGQCIVYDTTYKHYTKNNHPTQSRVVVHVDFFNTLVLTSTEITILQYIYNLREQFMKAEGVSKVSSQRL